MSLVSQINSLATRIGTEFKTIRSEMAGISGGGAVSSVNAKTGVVVLSADDIGDGTTKVIMTAAERAELATKIDAFADPNADRIVFWDDSAGAFVALSVTAPLSITGTAMAVAAATTAVTGTVILATQAVVTAGTNAVQPVTPATLKGQQAAVVVLTDAATIAIAITAAVIYRVTMAASRTLGIPSNPLDGQRILIQATASGGDWTLTLTTGSVGAFKFGTDVTTIPAILNGTTTFIGAIYRSASSRWHVLAVSSGH